MKEEFKIKLFDGIKRCSSDEYISIIPYSKSMMQEKKNHFLIMMKPEIVDYINNVDVYAIINTMLEVFNIYNICINACYVAGGTFIKSNSLMEKQYSMLNRGSHTGLNSFASDFSNNVKRVYEGRKIIGAYEFITEYPEFSAERLEKISHEIGSQKIGNGLYLLKLDYNSNRYGIINAFHPHQLKYFNSETSKMVFCDCCSDTDYENLAQKVIGYYDPSSAACGSLRNTIYIKQKKLNILDVGIFHNGFHISPSPLEGMFATLRYGNVFLENISIEDTCMGKKLMDAGFSCKQIMEFQNNPYLLRNDQWESLFDISEGENEDYIIEFIKQNNNEFRY